MPRGNQLARQWQLLQMIQHPAGIAVEDAAGKLACTVRTIWRDLEVLQKAGFTVESGEVCCVWQKRGFAFAAHALRTLLTVDVGWPRSPLSELDSRRGAI